MRYAVFETSLGWVAVLASEKGLASLSLPLPSAEEARRQLGTPDDLASGEFPDLISRIRAYLAGQRVAFPDPLDTGGSPFQREVWAKTSLIPYGETRSYSWVVGQVGRPAAARAVGQALSQNPLPIIIPCHRVMGKDGRPGGFSGGLWWKLHLLSLEGSGISRA